MGHRLRESGFIRERRPSAVMRKEKMKGFHDATILDGVGHQSITEVLLFPSGQVQPAEVLRAEEEKLEIARLDPLSNIEQAADSRSLSGFQRINDPALLRSQNPPRKFVSEH